MRKLTCLLAWLLMALITNAQVKRISGTVVSKADGKPLLGVSVQSGPAGTATDSSGSWTLQAKRGDRVLFSFTGMKMFTLTVGDAASYNVQLEQDQRDLGEIVV